MNHYDVFYGKSFYLSSSVASCSRFALYWKRDSVQNTVTKHLYVAVTTYAASYAELRIDNGEAFDSRLDRKKQTLPVYM